MKIWITTYALTDGILTGELIENCAIGGNDFGPNSVVVALRMNNPHKGKRMCFHKPHWWTLEVDARNRAEQMRKTRIKSLEKSLDKIRKLEIKVIDP